MVRADLVRAGHVTFLDSELSISVLFIVAV